MCVIAQGSSVQLLIAILVMLFYMLLVLKTAPYAFIACVALTLTTIGGFALITDDPTIRTYESTVLTIVLIGINVICFVLEIILVVVFDCGVYERCADGGGDGGDAGGKKKTAKVSNSSKVVPVRKDKLDIIEDAAKRAWGMEGGAD